MHQAYFAWVPTIGFPPVAARTRYRNNPSAASVGSFGAIMPAIQTGTERDKDTAADSPPSPDTAADSPPSPVPLPPGAAHRLALVCAAIAAPSRPHRSAPAVPTLRVAELGEDGPSAADVCRSRIYNAALATVEASKANAAALARSKQQARQQAQRRVAEARAASSVLPGALASISSLDAKQRERFMLYVKFESRRRRPFSAPAPGVAGASSAARVPPPRSSVSRAAGGAGAGGGGGGGGGGAASGAAAAAGRASGAAPRSAVHAALTDPHTPRTSQRTAQEAQDVHCAAAASSGSGPPPVFMPLPPTAPGVAVTVSSSSTENEKAGAASHAGSSSIVSGRPSRPPPPQTPTIAESPAPTPTAPGHHAKQVAAGRAPRLPLHAASSKGGAPAGSVLASSSASSRRLGGRSQRGPPGSSHRRARTAAAAAGAQQSFSKRTRVEV